MTDESVGIPNGNAIEADGKRKRKRDRQRQRQRYAQEMAHGIIGMLKKGHFPRPSWFAFKKRQRRVEMRARERREKERGE